MEEFIHPPIDPPMPDLLYTSWASPPIDWKSRWKIVPPELDTKPYVQDGKMINIFITIIELLYNKKLESKRLDTFKETVISKGRLPNQSVSLSGDGHSYIYNSSQEKPRRTLKPKNKKPKLDSEWLTGTE